MKCPICGKDVELQKKQVGVDEQGAPVFHQYAVCRDCKKQWNLDKQRARKAAPDGAANTGKAEPSAVMPEKESNQADHVSPSKPVRRKAPSEGAVTQRTAAEGVGSSKEAVSAPSAGRPLPEKKAPQKAAPDMSPGEPRKRPAADPGSGEPRKKPAADPGSGESRHKAGAEQSSAESKAAADPALPEEKARRRAPAGQRAAQGSASAEVKPVRKPASGNAPAEGSPRRPASGEPSSDRKGARKLADGSLPAEGQTPRRAPAGGPSPEKGTRNPEAHKPAGEKAKGGKPVSGKRPSGGTVSEKAPGERPGSGKPPVKKRAPGGPVNPETEVQGAGAPKKRPVRKSAAETEEQRYGNIPPEKVRVKKEHAVRKGYEDMLSTDPNHKPAKKKKPLPEEEQPVKKERPVPVKKRPDPKASLEDEYEDEDEMDYDDAEYTEARFRLPRIILGVISVLAAGFFAYGGFFEGLENIASGSTVSTGTTFIIFAICMLVSGLLLLIMQNRNTIFAFILPMLFYFGAAVFTFLKRQDDKMFLFCAIGAAVAGILFLVLGIVSRNSDGYEDDDEYDDPFEDDYE